MNKKLLTEGNIFGKLIIFALPLVIGSLFQLTYNLFDFAILGWFGQDKIGSTAAISAATPIISIFIALFSGLCAGAGIHTSELFGNDNEKPKLKKQIISFYIVGIIFSLLVSVLFIALLNPILTMSNINSAIREDCYFYLLIIAIGFIFSFIYNNYASCLRSIGDSVASLIFLILSCVLNIGLNILFVVVFKMEVKGVALSTLISQILSAISVMIYAKLKYKDIFIYKKEEIKIDKELIKISAKYAVASALQQIVLFVGKYIISTQINRLGINETDSFGIVTKIDDFIFFPAQNIGHATAIFIATNKGAKKYDRAKKGFLAGLSINVLYGIVISLTMFFAKEEVLTLFISNDANIQDQKNQIITLGLTYMNVMVFCYLFPCITNSIQSYFRGIGKLDMVFYSTFVQIVSRVLVSIILINTINAPLAAVAYGTMVGWICMILFETPFLIYYYKTNKKLVINESTL